MHFKSFFCFSSVLKMFQCEISLALLIPANSSIISQQEIRVSVIENSHIRIHGEGVDVVVDMLVFPHLEKEANCFRVGTFSEETDVMNVPNGLQFPRIAAHSKTFKNFQLLRKNKKPSKS